MCWYKIPRCIEFFKCCPHIFNIKVAIVVLEILKKNLTPKQYFSINVKMSIEISKYSSRLLFFTPNKVPFSTLYLLRFPTLYLLYDISLLGRAGTAWENSKAEIFLPASQNMKSLITPFTFSSPLLFSVSTCHKPLLLTILMPSILFYSYRKDERAKPRHLLTNYALSNLQ
jgi:hypothetical protein